MKHATTSNRNLNSTINKNGEIDIEMFNKIRGDFSRQELMDFYNNYKEIKSKIKLERLKDKLKEF